MYGRVIVPLDGSEFAECVFPHVAALTRGFDADVVLLRAVTHDRELLRESTTPQTPELGMDVARRRREAESASAQRYLTAARERLTRLGGMHVELRVRPGPPAAAILEAAHTAPEGTLVVMATRGRGGLRRLVGGSVVDRVAQELRGRPLVLFRPDEE